MGGLGPTKRGLDAATVAAAVGDALGTVVAADACEDLSTGSFASVWKAELTDGREVVLKVAPPPDAPLLRYEHGLLEAEARYDRLVERGAVDVPVPTVLYAGPSEPLAGAPILVGSFLPGQPLSAVADTDADTDSVREAVGRATAAVHRLAGPRFGYDGPRPSGRTWPEAFSAIVESLLADAVDWNVELPAAPSHLRRAVERCRPALAAVESPAPVHFDLWDGNVLVTGDERQGWRLGGLIDGERWLYADPLLEFVSVCLYGRIEDGPHHPFVRGYAEKTGAAVVFGDAERVRLALYRAHLYLLMLVEMPSRGMSGSAHDDRRDRLSSLLVEELSALD